MCIGPDQSRPISRRCFWISLKSVRSKFILQSVRSDSISKKVDPTLALDWTETQLRLSIPAHNMSNPCTSLLSFSSTVNSLMLVFILFIHTCDSVLQKMFTACFFHIIPSFLNQRWFSLTCCFIDSSVHVNFIQPSYWHLSGSGRVWGYDPTRSTKRSRLPRPTRSEAERV